MLNNFIFKYLLIGSVIGVILFIIFLNTMERLESQLRPSFDALCEIMVKKEVNYCIDDAIAMLNEDPIYKPSDFYNVKFDENGNVSLIENNSIIINQITNDISYSLEDRLSELGDVEMKLRIMDILYPEAFDHVGPMYTMHMTKDGYAIVNYKSEINEVSGNQTNFKAYVQIAVYIRVISPLYSENITINRDVLLVDTVISTKNVGLKIN